MKRSPELHRRFDSDVWCDERWGRLLQDWPTWPVQRSLAVDDPVNASDPTGESPLSGVACLGLSLLDPLAGVECSANQGGLPTITRETRTTSNGLKIAAHGDGRPRRSEHGADWSEGDQLWTPTACRKMRRLIAILA